jgi:hypothetical protein
MVQQVFDQLWEDRFEFLEGCSLRHLDRNYRVYRIARRKSEGRQLGSVDFAVRGEGGEEKRGTRSGEDGGVGRIPGADRDTFRRGFHGEA